MAAHREQSDSAPIVMVHGLFGWNGQELFGYPYFRSAERITTGRKALRYYPEGNAPRLLFPGTGAVSSLHDQACELFYQLKGGTVDYGEAHSAEFGHKRFGRTYDAPLYAEWDAAHPLDFVAHSMGAAVVRMLQYLLANAFFHRPDGTAYETAPSWIRSVSAVAGVHNGSTLAWILGCSETDGTLKNTANFIGLLGTLFAKWQKLSDKNPAVRTLYDLQLDQWDIGTGTPPSALFASDALEEFFKSRDAAPYDLTPNAMARWNTELIEYPDTWYFSYPVCATIPACSVQLPLYPFLHLFLLYFGFKMGTFVCAPENPFRALQKKFRANDGMCPTWSELRPILGRDSAAVTPDAAAAVTPDAAAAVTPAAAAAPFVRPARSDLPASGVLSASGGTAKGIWHCMKPVRGRDHADVAMLPRFFTLTGTDRLYKTVFDRIYLLWRIT